MENWVVKKWKWSKSKTKRLRCMVASFCTWMKGGCFAFFGALRFLVMASTHAFVTMLFMKAPAVASVINIWFFLRKNLQSGLLQLESGSPMPASSLRCHAWGLALSSCRNTLPRSWYAHPLLSSRGRRFTLPNHFRGIHYLLRVRAEGGRRPLRTLSPISAKA